MLRVISFVFFVFWFDQHVLYKLVLTNFGIEFQRIGLMENVQKFKTQSKFEFSQMYSLELPAFS